MIIIAVDPVFGLDKFNSPAVLQEDETIVNNILTVLFGRPGFYASMPKLGIDITQYLYNFKGDIDTDALLSKLISQCTDVSEYVNDGTLSCKYMEYKGSPMLLFVLPGITKNNSTLCLSVTTNVSGQPVYNFVFNKTQLL